MYKSLCISLYIYIYIYIYSCMRLYASPNLVRYVLREVQGKPRSECTHAEKTRHLQPRISYSSRFSRSWCIDGWDLRHHHASRACSIGVFATSTTLRQFVICGGGCARASYKTSHSVFVYARPLSQHRARRSVGVEPNFRYRAFRSFCGS